MVTLLCMNRAVLHTGSHIPTGNMRAMANMLPPLTFSTPEAEGEQDRLAG